MSVSTFRTILDAVLRLFHTEATQAAEAVSAVRTAGMSEQERDAALTAARAVYVASMTAATRRGRERAWAAAALHLEEQARTQAGRPAFVPAPPRYDDSLVTDEVRTAGGPVVAKTTRDRVVVALDRHIETAARQTVAAAVDPAAEDAGAPQDDEPDEEDDSAITASERHARDAKAAAAQAVAEEEAEQSAARLAAADKVLTDAGIPHPTPAGTTGAALRPARPFAWARVLRPSADRKPCGLCVIAAARGPVYSSAYAAGAHEDVNDRVAAAGVPADRFHDHCHCLAVPIYSSRSWPGKADFERLHDAYQEIVVDGELYGSEARTAMDTWSRGNRTAEKRRLKKAVAWRTTLDSDKAERLRRQHALASDMSRLDFGDGTTELLEAHELDFLEKFEAIGERVTWIPRAPYVDGKGRAPTNDFEWTSRGGVVSELKHTGDKYGSIAGRIKDAVSRAAAHDEPVVKDTFVIHLDYPLKDGLRRQLERYNLNSPTRAIRQMWVFDGTTLTQIDLAQT